MKIQHLPFECNNHKFFGTYTIDVFYSRRHIKISLYAIEKLTHLTLHKEETRFHTNPMESHLLMGSVPYPIYLHTNRQLLAATQHNCIFASVR